MTTAKTHIDQIPDAERIRSHDKDYTIVKDGGGWAAYAVLEAGAIRQIGVSTNRMGAGHIVEEEASGRSAERTRKFTEWLDSRESATPQEIRDAVAEQGFVSAHMGGGTMAWERDAGEGERILICTEDSDIDGDPLKAEWLVGRHSENGGMVEVTKPMTLMEALAASDRLPSAVDANGLDLEISAGTVEETILRHAVIEGDIEEIRERMGYDGLLKARGLVVDGLQVDVGLIGPGHAYGDAYAVAIHTDCDPEHPHQGSSELHTFDDEASAVAFWRESVGMEPAAAPGI